ncbi:hypothetical protein CYMTET_39546 [Cymbomonas tetramitiformis]|uniref:Uncharacterized protein n=1 Tax=Cymbomonas tetramitiformis TaxID=36881 RepID=A0AAE0C9W6_9CHLO|nr:hypothetical protein CYMTET_39546 [Cymbomonas tetramitiformis]
MAPLSGSAALGLWPLCSATLGPRPLSTSGPSRASVTLGFGHFRASAPLGHRPLSGFSSCDPVERCFHEVHPTVLWAAGYPMTTLSLANAVGAATAMGRGAGRNVASAQDVASLLCAAAENSGFAHQHAARAALLMLQDSRVAAGIQVSCTGEGYIATVSDILWKVAEECLGAEQREFVEKAAGGVGTSTGWMRRYADADIFFGDLALSMLVIDKLQKLSDGLTRKQTSKETANAFHSRLSARQRTVNFLAKVVPGCISVSDVDFGHHF